eukprot:s1791_g11.t1
MLGNSAVVKVATSPRPGYVPPRNVRVVQAAPRAVRPRIYQAEWSYPSQISVSDQRIAPTGSVAAKCTSSGFALRAVSSSKATCFQCLDKPAPTMTQLRRIEWHSCAFDGE